MLRAEVLPHTKNMLRQEMFKVEGCRISVCEGLVLWDSLKHSVALFLFSKNEKFCQSSFWVYLHARVCFLLTKLNFCQLWKVVILVRFSLFLSIRVYRAICSAKYMSLYFDIYAHLHSCIPIILESQSSELPYSNNFHWFAELNLLYLYCKTS